MKLIDASELVDRHRNFIISFKVFFFKLDEASNLDRVAWELAKFEAVIVETHAGATGVNGGGELGGNVRDLGSRIVERTVGMIRLVVVAGVRIVGRCVAVAVLLRHCLVALGLCVHRCVVSALWLVMG